MMMPDGWDESNNQRRKRMYNSRLKTARNFNLRINQFVTEIDNNYSLSKSQKLKIVAEIFNGFNVP